MHRNKKGQNSFIIEPVNFLFGAHKNIKFGTAKRVQKILLQLFSILNTRNLIPFSGFFYTKYQPTTSGIGKCRNSFPNRLWQLSFGSFHLKIFPFEAVKFLYEFVFSHLINLLLNIRSISQN